MSTPAEGVKFVGLNGRAEEVADLSVNERWQALPSGWKVFAVERNVPASAAADASSSAAPASASKKHKDMFFQGPDMPSDKCLRSLTQVRLQLGLGEPAPHSPSAASTKKAKRAAPPSDASSGDDFEGDRDDDDAAAKDAKDAKGDQKAPRRRNKKKKKKAPRMMDSASYGKGSGDEDSDDDEVGLDADPSVGGGSGGKKRKVKKDPNKPKGATSAYLYYSKGARAAVKAASPEMSFGDIGKKIGADWKALGEDAKKPYEALAEADKARHAMEMQGYEAPPVEYEVEKKNSKKKKKDPNMPKKGLSA